jgi:hypothetical protein
MTVTFSPETEAWIAERKRKRKRKGDDRTAKSFGTSTCRRALSRRFETSVGGGQAAGWRCALLAYGRQLPEGCDVQRRVECTTC